jgi:multiple sugar transport system permease protein
MRKEEMDPEKDEGDSFPDDPVIDLLPEETSAGIFAEETVTDYLPEKSGIDFLREETESDFPREESLSDPLPEQTEDISVLGEHGEEAAAAVSVPAAPVKTPGPSLDERFRKFWTKKRIEILRIVIRTAVAGFFAVLFLMPIVLTITNSLMTKSEINANYGVIFAKRNGVRVFISNTVNLKFIPDIVTFEQYFKVLILSPEYLLKFWNSVIYVVPIVVFQLAIASLASYGFARYRGRVREVIFFAYIILMLMPYQVTLVPNYLVSSWLNILDTRWAIWLPGFFSPFAVYMLTKYMRRIPKSIYEAAEIDGAGEWQIFTKICLPNCKGGLASIAILLFIDYWNMVEQPLILLSNDQLHPLSVFLSKINSGEISLAFAVAVIYMVLPMMVFLYGEESLVEGIVYQGGIKE